MHDPVLAAVITFNGILAQGGKPLTYYLKDNFPTAPKEALRQLDPEALPLVSTLPPDDEGEFRRTIRTLGGRIVDQGKGIVEISVR